ITVNGMTTNLTIGPQVKIGLAVGRDFDGSLPPPMEVKITTQSFTLWAVLNDTQLLLSSSDLSHVTVKRRDAVTGKVHEWTVDCSNPDTAPDFWLRDGDEIEVPEASGQ